LKEVAKQSQTVT